MSWRERLRPSRCPAPHSNIWRNHGGADGADASERAGVSVVPSAVTVGQCEDDNQDLQTPQGPSIRQ